MFLMNRLFWRVMFFSCIYLWYFGVMFRGWKVVYNLCIVSLRKSVCICWKFFIILVKWMFLWKYWVLISCFMSLNLFGCCLSRCMCMSKRWWLLFINCLRLVMMKMIILCLIFCSGMWKSSGRKRLWCVLFWIVLSLLVMACRVFIILIRRCNR